jgi:hypothetical protein
MWDYLNLVIALLRTQQKPVPHGGHSLLPTASDEPALSDCLEQG